MTVRELVTPGRYPWHGGLGLTANDADRTVDSLSGGERQRAWIAMLVAQNGRCMLLDKPTSALDAGHQPTVLEFVRTLCAERVMTAVIVMHDIDMAARFCDRIVALPEGRLLVREDAADVADPARLEAIYGVPMSVTTDAATGRRMDFPL
jgi:ferric hydroxamate transport system ATP-binding protein